MTQRHLRYYSQQGEDCLLWNFFDFKRQGFFVDVGAFDGTYLSNSLSFEEQGWRGICVEALQDLFQLCRQNRPGTTCVHAACVGDHRTTVKLYRDQSGLFSGIAPDMNKTADLFANHKVKFHGFEEVKVPAMRLDEIVLRHADGPIDFVSIDVEGAELDVLQGFDLALHRTRVLVIEANSNIERRRLDAYLMGRGYILGRSMNWNHFYVSNPDDAKTLRSIAISAKLEKPTCPGGYNKVGDVTEFASWEPITGIRLEYILATARWKLRSMFSGIH